MGRLMEDQFYHCFPMLEIKSGKIHQRQAEGIAVAKSQGKHLGRPPFNLSALSHKQLIIIEETYEKWKKRNDKR